MAPPRKPNAGNEQKRVRSAKAAIDRLHTPIHLMTEFVQNVDCLNAELAEMKGILFSLERDYRMNVMILELFIDYLKCDISEKEKNKIYEKRYLYNEAIKRLEKDIKIVQTNINLIKQELCKLTAPTKCVQPVQETKTFSFTLNPNATPSPTCSNTSSTSTTSTSTTNKDMCTNK